MSPKPIKSVGKVRPEAIVEETKERSSKAFKMAVDGTSFTPEHIARIDAQVASGELHDDLNDEIEMAIGEIIDDQESYTLKEFSDAVSGGVFDALSGECFKSSFDFQKKGFDSIREAAAGYRKKHAGKKHKELSPQEKRVFDKAIADVKRDPTMGREGMLVSEVDRVMSIIRRNTLSRLGIEEKQNVMKMDCLESESLGQMIPGIEPMEISGDDEDESPSDVHMDLAGLDSTLSGVASKVVSEPHVCRCNGHCHSRGG